MNRFKIPRVVVQPTNTSGTERGTNVDRILVSFYDGEDPNNTNGNKHDVRVMYGAIGSGMTVSANLPNPTTTTAADAKAPSGSEIVANDDTTHKGSMYTAAGLLSNGLPVVACNMPALCICMSVRRGSVAKYGGLDNKSKSETPGRTAHFLHSPACYCGFDTANLNEWRVDRMASSATIQNAQRRKAPVTTYHEKKIGKCLYRVTSVYKGEVELGKALEDLTVKKILSQENVPP